MHRKKISSTRRHLPAAWSAVNWVTDAGIVGVLSLPAFRERVTPTRGSDGDPMSKRFPGSAACFPSAVRPRQAARGSRRTARPIQGAKRRHCVALISVPRITSGIGVALMRGTKRDLKDTGVHRKCKS